MLQQQNKIWIRASCLKKGRHFESKTCVHVCLKICWFIKTLVDIKEKKSFLFSIDGRECSTRYLREINHTIGYHTQPNFVIRIKVLRIDINRLSLFLQKVFSMIKNLNEIGLTKSLNEIMINQFV